MMTNVMGSWKRSAVALQGIRLGLQAGLHHARRRLVHQGRFRAGGQGHGRKRSTPVPDPRGPFGAAGSPYPRHVQRRQLHRLQHQSNQCSRHAVDGLSNLDSNVIP
jgi:hypothetical protein